MPGELSLFYWIGDGLLMELVLLGANTLLLVPLPKILLSPFILYCQIKMITIILAEG